MRLAITIGSLSGVNVILTFLFQWYLVTTIGPGPETDAFFVGMTIPQIISSVITGSLIFVLIPLFSNEEEDDFHKSLWSFFQLVGLLFFCLFIFLSLTSNLWVPFLVPGFKKSNQLLTVSLTQIQLIGMFFTALSGLLGAAYNSRKKYIWVNVSNVLSSAICLVFLAYFLIPHGIKTAAWALVIRSIFLTLFLIPILGRYQKFDKKNKIFQMSWSRIKPLIMGSTYYKCDILVDRFFASMASSGSISLLQLGQQIYGAANTIITSSIATPLVPLLAQNAYKNDWKSFQGNFRKRLNIVIFLTSVIFVLLIIIGKPVLKLIFQFKNFDSTQVDLLWIILIALFGVLICGSAGQILSTSFYSKGDTKTPTRIGVIGFSIGIILKVILFYFIGIIGIALATSIYMFLTAILQLIILNKSITKNIKLDY